MMIVRNIAFAALIAFVAPVLAEDAPTTQKVEMKNEGLAKKLVAGSPWSLTAGNETNINNFRLTDEGTLQRQSASTGKWKDFTVTEAQTASFETRSGRVITFFLRADGVPDASYSNGTALLRSIKD